MTQLDEARAALAPNGELRAAINLGNFLLVTGKADNGDPTGVSPSVAAALAERLSVPLRLIGYETPGQVADAAVLDEWDIGNIGAEPKRAETINFTAAYCEIESTYMVPPGSTLRTVEEVDQPGNRIAVSARSAYELWLSRNIKHAQLVLVEGLEASYQIFEQDKLEALAGLRPRLIADVERMPGARILEQKFSAVQQAVGTPKSRSEAGIKYLVEFVEELKANGTIAQFIAQHEVRGLSVAPPA